MDDRSIGADMPELDRQREVIDKVDPQMIEAERRAVLDNLRQE